MTRYLFGIVSLDILEFRRAFELSVFLHQSIHEAMRLIVITLELYNKSFDELILYSILGSAVLLKIASLAAPEG
jgi:hypothetical protein